MQIKKKSTFGLKGRLIVLEKVGYGPTKKVVDDDNIVLNTGKVEAIKWLVNGSSFAITSLAVGNGNSPNVVPDEDDAGLSNELSKTDVISSGIDESNRWTTFRASFNSGDPDFEPTPDSTDPFDTFNLPEINEAGLILSDGTSEVFFSKKNFQPRPFESTTNITLTFIWMVGVV